MVALSLSGKNHPPKSLCIWGAILLCFLSVFFMFIPVTHANFSMPALCCNTLFPYDRSGNVFKSRSIAVVPGEMDDLLKSSIHLFNHRHERFPRYRHKHNMLEMMTEWALQPFLYILRNLKILYAFLIILLMSYVIYINACRGIQLFKNKYWK